MTTEEKYTRVRYLCMPVMFTLATIIVVVVGASIIISSTEKLDTVCLSDIPNELWWPAKCIGVNSTLVAMEIIGCEVTSVVRCVTNNTLLPGDNVKCWYAAVDAKCADAGKNLTMNPVYNEPKYIVQYERYTQCIARIQYHNDKIHVIASYILGMGLGLQIMAFVSLGLAGSFAESRIS